MSEPLSAAGASSAAPIRLEWIDPASLDDNPGNWRRHPEIQMEALGGALDEVGWAGALLYNETTGRLIDGHARKALALRKGISCVPVLVGRWSETAERTVLLTLDPLAAMAQTDQAQLGELIREAETAQPALSVLLARLEEDSRLVATLADEVRAGVDVEKPRASRKKQQEEADAAERYERGDTDSDGQPRREGEGGDRSPYRAEQRTGRQDSGEVCFLRVTCSSPQVREQIMASLRADGHECCPF